LTSVNGTVLGRRANFTRGFDAGEGEEMIWKLTIPCAALLMYAPPHNAGTFIGNGLIK
jgi:hypothetical protein